MSDARFPPRCDRQSTGLEHLQHRGIPRQNIGGQLVESVLPGDSREVAHQSPADPLPLVRIVHDKGHFGTALPDHDITRAAHDDRVSVLLL